MRFRAPVLLIPWLASCGFAASGPSWEDQLSPSGPCYEADLADGIDAPAELHTVFACLNQGGTLDAMRGLDAALDAPTREGLVGVVAVAWLTDLGGSGGAGAMIGALLEEGRALVEERSDWEWVVRLGLELLYGRGYGEVVTLDLAAPSQLAAGLLVPLSPVIGQAAGAILDDDLAPLGPVSEFLRSEALPSLLWSAALLPGAGSGAGPEGTALAALASEWPADLARTIQDVADTSNNRHPGSGDSLRDLIEAVLVQTGDDGRPALAHLSDPLLPILADPALAGALTGWIGDELALGNLQRVPEQLLYLASVDRDGGVLEAAPAGEDSALASMVRMLARANQPVRCEARVLGLWPVSLEVDNLSVRLLELLADQDPDDVEGVVALLSILLGVDWLTGPILDAVPDYCPVLDDQMIGDLYALDRLTDEPAHGLVHALVTGLQAVGTQGAESRIPEVVDLISAAESFGLVPPLEEGLRDLVGGPLLTHLMAALPGLMDLEGALAGAPGRSSVPPEVRLPDTAMLLGWMVAILSPDGEGRTPLDRLGPPLQAALAQEGTWEALAHLGLLLQAPDTELAGLLPRLLPLLEADPSISLLDSAADLLSDPALVRPALVLAEEDALRDAVFATSLTEEGPLPFLARLQVGGTLDALLGTLELFFDLLEPA